MKFHYLFFSILVVVLQSCSGSKSQNLESKDGIAILPDPKPNEKIADFAGGCFWAMQECMIELKGVSKVVSGYAGGKSKDPNYESVLSKTTGHTESVQVYYDPSVISFEELTEAFFYAHDPTQIDRQGPDIGSDYRSIAFYRTPEEYKIIRKVMDKVDSTHHYASGIITELIPLNVFYPAETQHQDYYVKNPWSPYIRGVSKPKVMKLRKTFPSLIKPEYLN